MTTPPADEKKRDGDEPAAGPWRVMALPDFAATVRAAAGTPEGRPAIVAVDGHGSSGKTTLTRRLEAAIPGAAAVHTDDVAWWHSPFGWDELMAEGVLEPLWRGEAVAFRPPAWEERGRPGAIEVPQGASLVLVEGVGAGRRETMGWVDAVLWVQSDPAVRARRDEVRVAAGEIEPDAYDSWMREEDVFVPEQRAWERAFAVVAGTPDLAHDEDSEVVVAPPVGAAPPAARATAPAMAASGSGARR